ncbi:Flp family type IVb pilin [Nitrosomonas communis]|uniref:Flp family type IVb pilin n=1 Tax=Nitrosomonas communis TaxID=44574 RepID=UPI0026EE0A32|nr:Flp family type IVb pilin [Nitrosomonas communis]MCO6428415.1 Flp family type IVb pilin [Nitrosomonas communis]
MNKLIQSVKQFMNDEQGMGAVEYALIVAVMAAAIIAGWEPLSNGIKNAFTTIQGTIETKAAAAK